jgi:putative transcriptional regulator
MMKEYISNNVHALREQRGDTQEELSEALGVSRQTIIAIEKGNYTPSVLLALKIALYFDTPVEKVFILVSRRTAI